MSQVRPDDPVMIQAVVATLTAVQVLPAARVREPVVFAPWRVRVSDVIEIVTVLIWFTNVIVVPTGYGTFVLESIVNVRALLSEVGWRIAPFASEAVVV